MQPGDHASTAGVCHRLAMRVRLAKSSCWFSQVTNQPSQKDLQCQRSIATQPAVRPSASVCFLHSGRMEEGGKAVFPTGSVKVLWPRTTLLMSSWTQWTWAWGWNNATCCPALTELGTASPPPSHPPPRTGFQHIQPTHVHSCCKAQVFTHWLRVLNCYWSGAAYTLLPTPETRAVSHFENDLHLNTHFINRSSFSVFLLTALYILLFVNRHIFRKHKSYNILIGRDPLGSSSPTPWFPQDPELQAENPPEAEDTLPSALLQVRPPPWPPLKVLLSPASFANSLETNAWLSHSHILSPSDTRGYIGAVRS